jgi:Protein of unknown function (DUF551).
MSKWISVDDRSPEPLKEVLLYCSAEKYQCVGFYIPEGYLVEDDSSWAMDVLEYDEETDMFIVPSGFYESIRNWPERVSVKVIGMVTHWMELPEAPKEVKA